MFPEAIHIVAGNFNHANLKVVLPKFHQHIKCATRGANTLDKAYSNIKRGFRAKQLPHLGQSDHMSLLLIPAYTPLRKNVSTILEEDCFQNNNYRQVWKGVQYITNYKPSNLLADGGDASLAEKLNHFFTRFEVVSPEETILHPLTHSSHILTVQEHEVRRTLKEVNPRKATGPDGILGRVLRECADQMAGVFTMILNQSLSQATVPLCLKSATIVPLQKKTVISSLNDYRPIALTPVIMKCFERLVRTHIISHLPTGFDPYQFAYRVNRSTEDAIATALHTALSHLELQGNYAVICGL